MAARIARALAESAADLWGSDAVRLAAGADAVDGQTPLVVLQPDDTATLAAMLRWARGERLAIAVQGGGTKVARGTGPARADVVLSTVRLNGSIDHCAGDLVATLPAGKPLAEVNAILGRERQWLPLDPPVPDRATIGGIVATNDSGPRRHKHGTPRDLIIGIEMALADGRIARGGGRVVKNVAGYDLPRLLCGSFGSLAVITSATFKLAPMAAASRTVVADAKDARMAGELTLALQSSALSPSAIELSGPPLQLMIRFESTERAAEHQATIASDLCRQRGARTNTIAGAGETAAWRQHEAHIWGTSGNVLKIAVLPADVAEVVKEVEDLAAAYRLECRVAGRASLGVLFLRFGRDRAQDDSADVGRDVRVLEQIRRNVEGRRGSVVVVSAGSAIRARLDPWGNIGDAFQTMRAVKARFDPYGTLNPGAGPGGL